MAGNQVADGTGAETGRLPDLSRAELREKWVSLFGNPAPRHISTRLLVKAVAFGLREKEGSGLSAITKRRLREIAAAIRDGREETVSLGPRIRPGTRLMRAWQGTTHVVDVLEEGFEWQGVRHGSLSAIAKAISGTNWNGYAFFGVKRRPFSNRNAAGPRRVKPSHDRRAGEAASDG